MTWSFDDGLALKKDKVRALIGDVDTTDQILTDEQINFAISQTVTIFRAAAMACEMAAAKYARDVSTAVDGFSESGGQRSKAFLEMAKGFTARDQASTSFSAVDADPMADSDFDHDADPLFDIGMFDNPEAS